MNKNVAIRLLKTLKPYMHLLIISLICALGYVFCSLYIPVLVGNGIDLIVAINDVDFEGLSKILILIAIFLVIASILQYVMNLCNNKMSFEVTRSLRDDCFKKIQKLPLKYLDGHSSGDIISRIISDVESVSDGLLLGFNQIFTGVIMIITTLVFMFVMNYIMALVVVILTPLSLFVAKFIAKRIHKYFHNQSVIKGEQTAFIDEMINGQKVIRAFEQEENKQAQFEEISSRLEEAAIKANFFSSLVNPSTRFVNAFVYALICFIGAIIAIKTDNFTAGMLTIFLSYASQYTKPFNDISSVVTELQNAFTCGERIFDLIDQEDEKQDFENAITLKDAKGKIILKNVYFAYEENQRLIEDFSLSVKPGQKVAIVGPTGCGKTTLINLLMRFYDVNSGDILIDDNSIYSLKRSSIRENYGMVLQETYLRHASVKENILMGSEISEEELNRIAKESNIDYFVSRLPNGFDTIIDENNGQLSQGQKQLLCIARVMVNLPPMLILDEATSSIDTRTEIKIQDAFNKMMQGRTSFIVAHRLSTIKNADLIIVMNEGHIIEQGNHQQLLAKKGFYYNLYNSQFAK